jgi:hypothetical protein
MMRILDLLTLAHAQAPNVPPIQTVPGTQSGGLLGIMTMVITWAFTIGGGVAVIYIIYGGISYMTAGSDENKTEQAKQTITFALTGLVLVALSIAILTWLTRALGQTGASHVVF